MCKGRVRSAVVAAVAVALVAAAYPRGVVAKGTAPGANASSLWTDPQTGQVFAKPGPGRVPLTPQDAPSNEAPGSPIQAALWSDAQTGEVFSKPGPGRLPLTPQVTASTEPPPSQIQTLQQETRELEKQVQALTNKNGLQLDGVNVKLGGFIETAGIYRTRNQVADVGSDYNQGIPFNNAALAHENETRFSARQSRLSLLVSADVAPQAHLAAYYEFDFLGSGTSSNSRESNSYTPRTRHIYATLDREDWGFHLLVGQNWSLLTTNTKGIMPRQEQIPITIDAQYVEGFNWLRVPQFRVVEEFGHGLWAGASAESPQVVTSPIVQPTGVNYTNPGNSAGLLNATTTYSNDWVPDLHAKIAYDPGWGHYEFKSLLRRFTARADGASRHTWGYGFGGAATMPIVAKYVDLQLSGLAGYGIGRYGSGQLPDAAFKADNIHLVAIPEAQGMFSLIGHPWAGNDLYVYGGWEHADRAGAPSTSGYGWDGLDVSGCGYEGGKTCQAETRDLTQITAGFWQDVYKGSYGRFTLGFQGGNIWRDAFSGKGGRPKTNIGIFMTSVRYYPFP
ncbi:MAG: uncharacterized protein H6Q86_4555 [candidate division NC10 bacterium]|nr:uncharacterized protein [candidate division NC10 bacterium]